MYVYMLVCDFLFLELWLAFIHNDTIAFSILYVRMYLHSSFPLQMLEISPGPAPPPYPSPGPAPFAHSSSGPAMSHHTHPGLPHMPAHVPPWMLPQDRVPAFATNGSRTVDSTQGTPSLPFVSPLSHNDSFFLAPSALNRSGSLSSRSDISLASESSFSSYTHDPNKKPKKKILRKPSDRQTGLSQKKTVSWKNEPTVSYIEAEEDNLSVGSSDCSYLPPTNPYWLASHHMGRWRDEDGRELLVHQPWMADNKPSTRTPGYRTPHSMKSTSPFQGGTNVAAPRRPFIDEDQLPAINPLNRVNPVMMAPPSRFPDDDMSDICSETGSELSLEARIKVDDRQPATQQASIGNGHPEMADMASHSEAQESTAKEALPKVSTPMNIATRNTRENILPFSPVRINDSEVSAMDDTAIEVQKDLGFRFPTHTRASLLEKPATEPPKVNLQLEVTSTTDTNVVQETGPSGQKVNGLSPSPTGEEDIPITMDSKLAEAVVKRDNEQKMKIMAARRKRASLELAETIYISGVPKEQLQALVQAQQQSALAAPSSSGMDEQASVKPEEPVNLTASTKETQAQVDGAKKKKDSFSILTRFGLNKLGRGKVVPRSKHDPLPSVPLLDALPDLTGESHYSEVDTSLREAILAGVSTQSPVSLTAPYASIDRLQMEMRQQPSGLVSQAPPPPAALNHASIMEQIASTGTLQQFSSPVMHTRSSSDTSVLLKHGQDMVQPQCTITSTGLKLTTKPVSHTTSLVTIPSGSAGQPAGGASQVGVVQVCHCEDVSSDAVCGVAGKLRPVAPRQADPVVQNGVTEPQAPHEALSMPQGKAAIASSLELERATNGFVKRLPPQESAKVGAQETPSESTQMSRPPLNQGNHIGIATGGNRRAASFTKEPIPATPASFQTVHASAVDHSAVETGVGRKLVSGGLVPQVQRSNPSSLPSVEMQHAQVHGTSAPARQGETTETGGGGSGKANTGAVTSKPPVPPKKLSISSQPIVVQSSTLGQQNLPASNSSSISGAPQARRHTSAAADLQTAARDAPHLPPRRRSLGQQQQPFASQSTEKLAMTEHTSQPIPPKVMEESVVKADAVAQDKLPLKEKPVLKPKAQPAIHPDPVQSAQSLPHKADKVKPPVKPKPPPVSSKPVLSGQIPSKSEAAKPPPSSTFPSHLAKGQEVTQSPLSLHPVPPVKQAHSNPPSASDPKEKTDGPAENDLLYDRLSDFWDIPQKVAAEAEGKVVSDQIASKSQTPEAAAVAQPSQTPNSAMSQPAATGPLQEEAEPVLRPYQKTGFYNSLSSISPSPSPTPSMLSGSSLPSPGPTHKLPSWTAIGVSGLTQEVSKASTAVQAKPNTAQGSAIEATDGNRSSKQQSPPPSVAQSQRSSLSPSPSSTKETQSVFLRKMLASSDQSIVPHHMLMVGEASKGRVSSSPSARQVPTEEASLTSVDTELEDLINELEDEAAAILRSQQAATTEAVQECG